MPRPRALLSSTLHFRWALRRSHNKEDSRMPSLLLLCRSSGIECMNFHRQTSAAQLNCSVRHLHGRDLFLGHVGLRGNLVLYLSESARFTWSDLTCCLLQHPRWLGQHGRQKSCRKSHCSQALQS